MRPNPANAAKRARATVPAARVVAFLLAILVAFSVASFSTAHAGTVGEAQVASGHPVVAASPPRGHQGHAHGVPCADSEADQGTQDDCCMSAASCAFCVPVPSADFAFDTVGDLAVSVTLSASLQYDPPTLSRPPKLSATG